MNDEETKRLFQKSCDQYTTTCVVETKSGTDWTLILTIGGIVVMGLGLLGTATYGIKRFKSWRKYRNMDKEALAKLKLMKSFLNEQVETEYSKLVTEADARENVARLDDGGKWQFIENLDKLGVGKFFRNTKLKKQAKTNVYKDLEMFSQSLFDAAKTSDIQINDLSQVGLKSDIVDKATILSTPNAVSLQIDPSKAVSSQIDPSKAVSSQIDSSKADLSNVASSQIHPEKIDSSSVVQQPLKSDMLSETIRDEASQGVTDTIKSSFAGLRENLPDTSEVVGSITKTLAYAGETTLSAARNAIEKTTSPIASTAASAATNATSWIQGAAHKLRSGFKSIFNHMTTTNRPKNDQQMNESNIMENIVDPLKLGEETTNIDKHIKITTKQMSDFELMLMDDYHFYY